MKNKKFDWKFNVKKKYNIIYADPPWKYGRVIEHYNCVPIKDINEFPIKQITAENCALFLWVI